ncbi:CO dehydrogenase/acetyl-CoA synthase complex subunit alpha [Candidatus Hecatella orcuttiae]|uniref:CO dehydrogenase/acetyl-CoA synthase complex subunit alpha n=1 Tax=Candidatus Hecatella orcuttiae TaxID=1935119 RepID=UPI002867B82F|nr:CO dehydrogenase/acetyl-CoA synthase complex subunit alpha [Candidatus Hecatella orcuttiae]
MKNSKIVVKELNSALAKIKGLEILVGQITEDWEEPPGPTPFPTLTSLREWDWKLLKKYQPFYSPLCDRCCLCGYGKCDLAKGRKGACGIDIRTQQGRHILLECVVGASAHTTHAKHLVDYLVKKLGRSHPIDLGSEIDIEAPLTRLITGVKPKTLGDLEGVLDYIGDQITQLLSSVLTGQEQNYLDFESKALHAGMLDNLALEVADIAQISGLGYPKGDAETPYVEIGLGVLDRNKPVIIFVGHNAAPGVETVEYLARSGLSDKVEVGGVCCSAHDLTRFNRGVKIVGNLSRQQLIARTGMADVLVLDQECIRVDIVEEAFKAGTRVIATIDQVCGGLPNRTEDPVDAVVEDLASGRNMGVLILDPSKAAEVAVRTAVKIAPLRRRELKPLAALAEASRCTGCGLCRRVCVPDLPVDEAVLAAAKGNLTKLSEVYDLCVGCGRCDSVCPRKIPVLTLIGEAGMEKIRKSKYKIRAGRGPILDTEIRNVGRPIVMGEIPGVVAFAGCSNYPRGHIEVAQMAEEFARRRYIVVTSGCAAMDIARYKDEEGRTLYEKYPGSFDAGGIVNTGSCVSNAHILGAAVKIANIFARRKLRANFEEIADYILNRIGAVAIVWGTQNQKAEAIATGATRLGIPVILGPKGVAHRRAYLGRPDVDEKWMPYNVRSGEKEYTGPAPEHLWYVAETKEEALVLAARLVMRPNDTLKGRSIKLRNYLDLYRKLYGTLPEDLHLFVRTESDLPVLEKDELLPVLRSQGWKPKTVPELGTTLLDRLVLRRR